MKPAPTVGSGFTVSLFLDQSGHFDVFDPSGIVYHAIDIFGLGFRILKHGTGDGHDRQFAVFRNFKGIQREV